jgi:broad specificity phosphatase PhoE
VNEHGQEVYLVRHGETAWSLSGQHTGSTEIPLTENGEKVARELGAKLAGHEFDGVLASPLSRAIETARLAGFEHGVQLDERLKEWDYGDYEGLTTPEIRETRPDWFLWRDGCPGGESPDQIGARAGSLVRDVRDIDGDVLLFAHGHILRVITARWLGYPPNDGMHFSLGTATLSILGFEREAPSMWRWNAP